MSKPKLEGILPPIPTSFDSDGKILHDRMASNLERWIAAGLHGVVALGSNGEYVSLNETEKCSVWETVRRVVPRERLFVAGAGAESTAGTIHLTRRAAELGADYVLIVTPHYYRGQMTGPTLARHFRAVADSSPLPVVLYNVPANTGIDMDASTIIDLAQHPNIAGIKDSGGNLAKMATVLAEAREDFVFLAGSGGFLFPALAVGAKGCIPALANVAPRECVNLYDAYCSGDFETARGLQLRLVALNTAVTARWSVPGLKAALDLAGYYGGPPRPPLLPLPEAERRQLAEIIKHTLD